LDCSSAVYYVSPTCTSVRALCLDWRRCADLTHAQACRRGGLACKAPAPKITLRHLTRVQDVSSISFDRFPVSAPHSRTYPQVQPPNHRHHPNDRGGYRHREHPFSSPHTHDLIFLLDASRRRLCRYTPCAWPFGPGEGRALAYPALLGLGGCVVMRGGLLRASLLPQKYGGY
jgi:hypothetical protein